MAAPEISDRVDISERILPIAVALAGVCMTALSVKLLLDAAQLGVFLHEMLGFIGVIFVNSVVLTFVAIRMTLSSEREATQAEKVVLLCLALCMAASLVAAYFQQT
ncbi:MAG: hypothetical protein NTX56_02570 [Proteobacteria bacterium]|nr:hypothetical protein [Pseudomonadota bacterium]